MIKNISGVCVKKKIQLIFTIGQNSEHESGKCKKDTSKLHTYIFNLNFTTHVNIICEESAVVSFFLRFILSLELNSGAILKVVSTKNNTCLTCVAHYSDTRSNSQCTAKHHNCLKNHI